MINNRKIAIIIISLILIITIVLGALINKKIIKDSTKLSENRIINQISVVVEDINYTEIKPNNSIVLNENLTKRYDVYNKENVVAYIYTGTASGLTGLFSLAIGITFNNTEYLINKVIMYSYSYGDADYATLVKYDNTFYPYFDNFNLKDNINVDTVSNATITSNSSIEIINAVKSQVQNDFDVIFSQYELTLISKKQNLQTLNFEYSINIKDNINNTNQDTVITIDQSYNIINSNYDSSLEEEIISLISKNKFNKNSLNIDSVDGYIKNVTNENGVYTIICVAKGYAGLVEVTYQINNKNIINTSVNLKNEIALSHTPGISNEQANNMAENGIDSISGATYTSNAIIKANKIVLNYIKEVL